jgi:hypothetical protein
VSLDFDTTGGTNFNGNNAIANIGNGNAVQTFDFTFTVPAITCTGPAGCTMQVSSSSGWFGCSTVKINNGPPDPNAPKPKKNCVKVQELIFCSQFNGEFVDVENGYTALQQDKQASDTYPTRYNGNVFSNGNSTECGAAYKEYLCRQALPHCGDEGACQSLCNNAIGTCQITDSHRGLYDCAKGPEDCDAAGIVQVGLLLIAFIVAFLTL